MNEQELQLAFIQFLAQKTGAKSQQELEAVIQQMGEEGLKQAYDEFMAMMQQQQVRAAKFGAKLNYIKQLRGQCPDGYEVKYFKEGGLMTKKCVACEKNAQEVMPSDPIEAFKCGRKMTKKKACGGPVKKDKCGSSIEMDKCGKKMKKKACGGSVEKDQKGNRVTLKKETSTGEPYERVTTRQWSDGTKSRREVSEGGTAYIGRRGEVGITNVPNDRQNAIADSLMRADWRTRTAPQLKKTVSKYQQGAEIDDENSRYMRISRRQLKDNRNIMKSLVSGDFSGAWDIFKQRYSPNYGDIQPINAKTMSEAYGKQPSYISEEGKGEDFMAGSPEPYLDKPAQILRNPDGSTYMGRVIPTPGDTVYIEPNYVPMNDPRYPIYRNEFNKNWKKPNKTKK